MLAEAAILRQGDADRPFVPKALRRLIADSEPGTVDGMGNLTIRPAYSVWPKYNRCLREVVGAMTEEQLATRPSPDRWPLWATVGHTACQRVFWLCDFAGEPGAETTPFTNAAYGCPGDDDLDHRLDAEALVEALDSSFRIVESCLDRWTFDMLDEVMRRRWDTEEWVHAPAGSCSGSSPTTSTTVPS